MEEESRLRRRGACFSQFSSIERQSDRSERRFHLQVSVIWLRVSISTSHVDWNAGESWSLTPSALHFLPQNMSPSVRSQFWLITSDEKKVEVDKDLLSAHSSVFRDMFETINHDTPECQVAETEEDVRLMMAILEGKGCADRSVEEMKRMIELAGKYDSPLLRAEARNSCW